MYFLNNLKDFYLYKNRPLAGIDIEEKDIKRNSMILLASQSQDDLDSFTKGNILSRIYFKSYYVPFKYTTAKLKKVKVTDQKKIYEEVKAKYPKYVIMKKNLSMYKYLNNLYDLSYETDVILSEIKTKGLKFVNFYLSFIADRYTSSSYKQKVIAIPVPDNIELTSINLTSAKSAFDCFFLAMRKKIVPESLNGANLLFYTSNGCYTKCKYNSSMKISDINKLFSKIVKASKSRDIEEDEVPEEIKDDKINDIIDKDSTIANINAALLSRIGINSNSNKGKILGSNIEELEDLVSEKLADMNVNIAKVPTEDMVKLLGQDPDILKQLNVVSSIANKGISDPQVINRLKSKQANVVFNGKKLDDIVEEANNLKIEDTVIDNENILNEEVKKSKIADFDKTYYEKQMQKDMLNVFTAFNNDEDIKLYVKDIKAENTSDAFTKKMTYTVTFEDENKVTHTFKINYPILKDGKFILANGGKKLILKQVMSLPVIKTKPDTVQISSNYNKLFIIRFGNKLNDGTENIKKLFASMDINESINKETGFRYRTGNSLINNKGFLTSLEYSELSKSFISFESKEIFISFNQKELNEILNDEISPNYKPTLGNKKFDKSIYFPLGYTKNNKIVYICNPETSEVFECLGGDAELKKVAENLTLFLIEKLFTPCLSEDKMKQFYAYNPSKTLAYNRVKVLNRTIPIIILLSYEKGLQEILNRYKVNYEFNTSARIPKKFGQKRIKFKDGFLLYNSLDLKTTLLLDGLTLLDTAEFNFEEMNTKTPYIEYFYEAFASRNVGKGIHNMLSLFLDPITLEILESLELPTNIVDLILYANTLLANSSYTPPNDMSNFRIRGAEQVNAVLYKVLADAFRVYKDTSNNGNPVKISVDPDILFKQLMQHKTIDEYSILNPSLEIDKLSAATWKGPSGINSDDAYTLEMRSFSESMKGVMAGASPVSDKVSVVRQMSLDPKIVNTRGMIDTDITDRNGNSNLYCPSELLNPFTVRHSDPPRSSMQSTQQKHLIPVNGLSRPLFGSGVDKSIAYMISDDFIFRAEEDGVLEKIDTEKEIAIVKYKSGKTDIIDLSEIVSKNSNGGFFIANQKQLLIKEGAKFKANQILAKNPNYFKGDKSDNIVYTTGRLSKIAVANLDGTMEDSSMISKRLSKDMTAKITMKKEVVLGVNSNIDFLIKKGANVKTGDDLVVFDTSFEDQSINVLLGSLGDDVAELNKNTLHSKYTGRIVDVVIYYNHPIEDYTPSVQAVLKEYIETNKDKVNFINQNVDKDNLRLINIKQTDKIDDTKIKGTDVDGLLIEVYIEYEDDLSVGDKVTYGTALKTIVSDVFEPGEEPFAESDPNDYLDAIFPPCSLVGRMTIDFFFQFYLNKAIMGLGDEITRIWKE